MNPIIIIYGGIVFAVLMALVLLTAIAFYGPEQVWLWLTPD